MKQTTLDLNGPILSFTTNPSSISVCSSGIATFVGIATATFPTQTPINPATPTGSISYRWYADGYGSLTDGSFLNATLTGTATTTLTISGVTSPTLSNVNFYVGADYVPSAYSQPTGSEVNAGTARSTGNAINDVLYSSNATLTVYPRITITTQPTSTIVTRESSATFNVVASLSDATQGDLQYKWFLNDTELSDGTSVVGSVSGSSTPTLSITYLVDGIFKIKVRISHPTSCSSPLFSNEVDLSIIPPSRNISIETITNTSTATISTHDLLVNGDLTLLAQNYTNASTVFSLYAKDVDTPVEMEIYSGKGNDFGSFSGGQGGYSKIRFTMKKNEEYVISGLNSTENCPFIYRKGQLIAVVGKGGNAANNGSGGAGGGIGISGQGGSGRDAGSGGAAIISGSLSSNGVFGSLTSLTATSPDTKAISPNGGRTIPCTRGIYWRQQGLSACQDIGNSQFRLSNGTLVSNTASITRGFKAGYGINATEGAGAAGYSYQQLVSRTCTRRVSQTCYRTVERDVTKSATITHYYDNVNFQTLSLTVSGDPFVASAFGSGGTPGDRRYRFGVWNLGLSNYDYTMAVSVNGNTTAAGGTSAGGVILVVSGFPVKTAGTPGSSFDVAFQNGTGQATFVRSFNIAIVGRASFQESYDCSYDESYDCSYYETVTVSGGGNGGRGATGGNGGGNGGSAGGGSGYSDGSVTVLSSTLGGSTGNARVIIRLAS